MLFNNLRQYLIRDEMSHVSEEEMLREHHYVSFYCQPNIMLEVASPRGDGEWLRGTYIQLIRDDDGEAIVIQLEGLPDDPYSKIVVHGFENTDVDVKVYRLIEG